MHRIFFVLIVGTTLTICISDLRFRRIPNLALVPLGVLLLLYQAKWLDLTFFYRTLVIGAVYLGIYLLSRRSLGAGDVKFAFVLGLAADSWRTLYIIHLITWISAGLSILLALLAQRDLRKYTVAFAPYLAAPSLWYLFTFR